jgi:hypothetical protein
MGLSRLLNARSLRFVALTSAVAGFAAFVWPTLYTPISVDLSAFHEAGGGLAIAARQNRVTGRVELFVVGTGWVYVTRQLAHPTLSRGDSLDPLSALEALACTGQKNCHPDSAGVGRPPGRSR